MRHHMSQFKTSKFKFKKEILIFFIITFTILATQRGHTEIVKYLVENGSNINQKNKHGKTALHQCK